MAEVATLVRAVKAHAVRHYEQNGWDFVVECWSDEEIAEVIGAAEDEFQAVAAVAAAVAPLAERRDEVRAEIF